MTESTIKTIELTLITTGEDGNELDEELLASYEVTPIDYMNLSATTLSNAANHELIACLYERLTNLSK